MHHNIEVLNIKKLRLYASCNFTKQNLSNSVHIILIKNNRSILLQINLTQLPSLQLPSRQNHPTSTAK